MQAKRIVTLFMFVGGVLGGYVPLLWGASVFSMSSIFLSAAGALLGIWIGFRLTR